MKKSVLGYTIVVSICLVGLLCLTLSTNKAVLMQEQETRTPKPINKRSKELLEIIRDKNLVTENPEKLAQAIQEIGERQISEAIPELIEYLNFRWERSGAIMRPWLPEESNYPAVGALFSIGKPALPALVKVIEEKESDSIESKNALRAIQLIFRDNLSEGIEYLEGELAKATDEVGKQRLQCAVKNTKAELLKIQNMQNKER